MERFLIIRTSSLGDIIHTLPAFASLRRARPEADIRWVVGPKGREILDWVQGLDGVIVTGTPGWRKEVRGKDRIALDFQGLLKSGLIALLSRSERRVGFHRTNLRERAAGLFYTDRPSVFPETEHVIRKNIHLLSSLGIEAGAVEFHLHVPESARRAIREILSGLGADQRTKPVLFNVGAAWPTKRWFPDRWAEVIRGTARTGFFPLLLWGSEVEKKIAGEVARQTGVPLVPFLTLQETLALINEASLIVSGDTFALQAACALNIPVVGLFGPTNPGRNGPFRPRDKIVYHEIECSLCYNRSCEKNDCLTAITSEEVMTLVDQAWKENA
jgi:lipopolysaccharide heptosyltransferase I